MGPLLAMEDEIEINLRSQIYLSMRILPQLARQKQSAIMNVSSGLAFVPHAGFPIYSATKAAIHSFTQSLRFQLRQTSVKVFELIPPIVYDTNLKGKPMEKTEWSVFADDVALATISGIEEDRYQITIGSSTAWLKGTDSEKEKEFGRINR